MGMLTKDELKQLGEVMDDKLDDAIEVVNKGFSGMQKQFDELKQDVSNLEKKVTTIEATMVTKNYLDEKMVNLESKLIAQDRKLEKKTDALVNTLVERRVITVSDVDRLEQARVFPRIVNDSP